MRKPLVFLPGDGFRDLWLARVVAWYESITLLPRAFRAGVPDLAGVYHQLQGSSREIDGSSCGSPSLVNGRPFFPIDDRGLHDVGRLGVIE